MGWLWCQVTAVAKAMRRALLGIAVGCSAAGLGLTAQPSLALAATPDPLTCTGQLPGNMPTKQPGPIRWGINPRVQVGQLGPLPVTALPEDPAQQLAGLSALSAGRPFVLRLNRIFWPEPAGQLAKLDSDVVRYGAAGYLLELQLRYHPSSGESATSPDDFAAWAAALAHHYDADPDVVSIQVTNEANFSLSADSSDGGYTYVKNALIKGIEAVHGQLVADGAAARVKVGFNWFYRSDPNTEKTFWTYLRDHGGPSFLGALDWVGLDAYPGTVFLPVEATGGYYTGMINALSTLHDCLMAYAGISKPIYIEETGFFTEGPDPSPKGPAVQLEALRELTGAATDYAGLYGVTDFRWFDLRDADSGSPNPQQHYGLLNSDYSRKPAFCAYSQVVTGAPCPSAAAPSAPTAGGPVVGSGAGLPTTAAPVPASWLGLIAAAGAVLAAQFLLHAAWRRRRTRGDT